jgi:transcription factor TFIIIB component B''
VGYKVDTAFQLQWSFASLYFYFATTPNLKCYSIATWIRFGMLKSRKATFKPKAQPARRPGAPPASAQSSTRQSVEPPTSTPAPETNPQPPTSTNQSAGKQAIVDAVPRPQSSQTPSAKEIPVPNEPARQRSPSPPKRKAQQEVEDQPPAKRVAVVEDELSSDEYRRLHNVNSRVGTYPFATPVVPVGPILTPPASNTSDSIAGKSTTTDVQSPVAESTEARAEPSINASPAISLITPAEKNIVSPATDKDISQDRASDIESADNIQNPTPPPSHNVSASPVEASEKRVPAPTPGTAPTSTTIVVDEPATSGNETATTRKKKRVTKRKAPKKKAGNDTTATTDVEGDQPEVAPKTTKKRRKRDGTKKRAKRAETPENAEDEVIDVTTITMADLCKDMKIGKKFSKADLIKERLSKQKAAVKAARDAAAEADDDAAAGDETEQTGQDGDASPPETGNLGLQMRVVDGHIVLNDETTQVSRQDHFDPSRVMEVVDEDDFTRVITQNTFGKQWGKPRTQAWDEAATEMFYKGLRTWGTDFETIAKMFPHRTRKQIKMKFNREEKDNGPRVTRTLNEPRGVVNHEESLAEFQTLSGKTLEEVGDIQAEYEKVQAEHDAEQGKRAQQKIDADAKKKAEIEAKSKGAKDLLDEDGDEVPESAKENAGAKKGRKKNDKKKKKNIHSSSRGGETMEVLASIEID